MFTRLRSFGLVFLFAAFLVVGWSGAAAQSDPLERNKATAARFFEVFANPDLVEAFTPMVAEDFVIHFPTGDVVGWDFVVANLASIKTSLPDLYFKPLIMLAEGNQVAVRYEFGGTFTEDMTNFDGSVIPATGGPVLVYANAILTFSDAGLVQEYGEVFDNLIFMTQLGAFPADPAMPMVVESVDPSVWTIADTSAEFKAALRESMLAANMSAYNDGNMDALDAFYAQDFVSYPTMTDLATTKAEITMLHSAIPDLQSSSDIIIAEGNWIAYHWTASGTFTGEANFDGMVLPPTNQPVSYEGIAIGYANEDGLIVAEWNEIDNLSLAMQFGMFEAMGG